MQPFSAKKNLTTRIAVNIDAANAVASLDFRYDPPVVDRSRTIPGRTWLLKEKKWTIPFKSDLTTRLPRLFDGYGYCVFGEAPSAAGPTYTTARKKQDDPETRRGCRTTGHAAAGKRVDTRPRPASGENKPASSRVETGKPPFSPRSLPDQLKKELLVRNYSRTTIRNYMDYTAVFLGSMRRPPDPDDSDILQSNKG